MAKHRETEKKISFLRDIL